MKINLKTLGSQTVTELRWIGETAEKMGCSAFLVGGVVRDLLLKRKNIDLDIVIEGDAIKVAQACASRKKGQIQIYPQFKTATIILPNGIVFDFATSRREIYSHPGALPAVEAAPIREDLLRRDFTINALAASLHSKNFGDLLDFCGGYEDLRKKQIRVLHDQSFFDDATRILRCVRFASRFKFRIEPQTLLLLKHALKHKVFETVKPPRYFAEFRKFFSEPRPVDALAQLAEFKGLDFISRRFEPSWLSLRRMQNRVLALEREVFYQNKNWSAVFFLGLWAGLPKKAISALNERFHFIREESFSLQGLAEWPEIDKQLQRKDLRVSAIYELLDPVDLEIIYFIRVASSVNIVGRRIDQFLKKWRLTKLQITGRDLQALGIQPGKEMGALLHALLLLKLDGKVKSRHDEIELARKLGFSH